MSLFSKIKKQYYYLYYLYVCAFNSLVKKQIKDPLSIPIIIINYNQLHDLKKLLSFLFQRNFKNIIIIDNQSDYPPLLSYYQEIGNQVTVEIMDKNYGHMVFFENAKLQKKYGKGYYIVTDADIIPNPNLPKDFMQKLIQILHKYSKGITKAGFALDIETIPDHYPMKEKVISWEKQFWEIQVEKDLYKANLDTTFALYKPTYPARFNNLKFLSAVRVAGRFTALHGGWYINPKDFSEENIHYIKSVGQSSTWKLDEKGHHDNKGQANYN